MPDNLSTSKEGTNITSLVPGQNLPDTPFRELPWSIPSNMKKMNTAPCGSGEIGSYAQLQHQIHDALREQHPEWIEKNGDCPTCESYESRFAELLTIFQSHERKSAA